MTIKEFEKLREKLIQEGKVSSEYIQGLGLLEGLMKISEPMPLESSNKIDKGFYEKARVVRHIYRGYEGKILSINLTEKITNIDPFIYHHKGTVTLLDSLDDILLFSDNPTLPVPLEGPMPRIVDIDNSMLLLQIYREAMNTTSYQKRMN